MKHEVVLVLLNRQGEDQSKQHPIDVQLYSLLRSKSRRKKPLPICLHVAKLIDSTRFHWDEEFWKQSEVEKKNLLQTCAIKT